MMHTDPSDDDTITDVQLREILNRKMAPPREIQDDLGAFRAVMIGGGIGLVILGLIAWAAYVYTR